MYPWLRVVQVIRAAKKAPRVDATALTQLEARVLPGDIDVFGHMNNGRYLTICDLGRFHMAICTGMTDVFKARKWHPVVGSATVRFRRSLELFQHYHLTTQLIFWDDKWFYVEHTFEHQGDIYARVLIKGVVRAGKTTVPMAEMVEALGQGERPPPPLPLAIKHWRQLESSMR